MSRLPLLNGWYATHELDLKHLVFKFVDSKPICFVNGVDVARTLERLEGQNHSVSEEIEKHPTQMCNGFCPWARVVDYYTIELFPIPSIKTPITFLSPGQLINLD